MKGKFKSVFVLLSVLLLAVTLNACAPKEVTFEDQCWDNAKDVEIVNKEDGTVEVTLKAPDYTKLLESIIENGDADNITLDVLAESIKENPDAVKEYNMILESEDEEEMKNALKDYISYEIIESMLEGVYE